MQLPTFVDDVLQHVEDPLKVLELCGGYYMCPTHDGRRIGPLVAYRGTYEAGKRFVGDLYANWAKVEQWPSISFALARNLLPLLFAKLGGGPKVYCGAPEGGKHLADKLALHHNARYCYAEKKGDELIWGRHEIEDGDEVVLVEDVSNNFSTTDKLLQLIQQAGGKPAAIATYLNRSPTVREMYHSKGDLALPVCALVSRPYPEYRQDDPHVAADIQSGNVVWDVKDHWDELMAAMITF